MAHQQTTQTDVATNFRLDQQIINDTLIPDRYEVWLDGVYKRKVFTVPATEGMPPNPNPAFNSDPNHRISRLERIAKRPIYVSSLGHRIDDATDLVALTFFHGFVSEGGELSPDELAGTARWKTIWVRRDQVSDTRKLIELSRIGVPVTSNNARDLIEFIDECLAENIAASLR